jgi:nucleotide-binding universal stress UspA family protein
MVTPAEFGSSAGFGLSRSRLNLLLGKMQSQNGNGRCSGDQTPPLDTNQEFAPRQKGSFMSINTKPIAVTTDLSAGSDRAVERAILLANLWNVRLKLVHAIEPGSKLDGDATRAEAAVRSVLPDSATGVDILLPRGSAENAIIDAAKESGCGLIITGAAHLNSLGDHFTGTTVDKIVRHSADPVLVVKQPVHGHYKTALVASDFSGCSREALLTAAAVFPDIDIHLFHAYHVPYEGWLKSDVSREDIKIIAQREMDEFLNDPAIPDMVRKRISPHLGCGEIATALGEAVDAVGADLVVVGTHGRSGFKYAIIGSVAEELLSFVTPDTLMVRERT